MNWHDLIGLGVIGVVIVLALFGLSQLAKPYNVSPEEFERRAREEPGLINAGMLGLQQILDPATKKSIEVQQDLRRGIYDDEEEPDDPPEAGKTAQENPRSR
jgi:hypothetical protein